LPILTKLGIAEANMSHNCFYVAVRFWFAGLAATTLCDPGFAVSPFPEIPNTCHPFYVSDSANPGVPGMLTYKGSDDSPDWSYEWLDANNKRSKLVCGDAHKPPDNIEICVVAPGLWNDDLTSGDC